MPEFDSEGDSSSVEGAVRRATAEPGETSDMDSGGFAPSSDGVLSRLFDGSAPGPQVPEIQRNYGLEREPSITLRGILRVATGSGVPPIAEILLGTILWVMGRADGVELGSDDSDDDMAPPRVPGPEGEG